MPSIYLIIFWAVCALIIGNSIRSVILARDRMYRAKRRMEETKAAFERIENTKKTLDNHPANPKKEKKEKKKEVRSIFDESENSW